MEQTVGSDIDAETMCAYCHWGLLDEPARSLVHCASCAAAYHAECWAENGGCAVYGCSEWSRTQQRRQGPELTAQPS